MNEALRLFVVDENEEIGLLVRVHLQRAGHEVTLCRTGADALIVLGQNPHHLVLLDDRLPDMDGLHLLHTLTHEGIQTPVLVMTAHGDEKLATQALLAGAIDYMVKDNGLAFLAELPKRVQEAVTRHRLLQANRLFSAALESARDGVCITDCQGMMLHVNRALETLTGCDRHQLIGQQPLLQRSDVQGQQSDTELWPLILACQSWHGEVWLSRQEGPPVETSLTLSPILGGRDRVTHFVAIFRDITERKQLQRQLLHAQKMQSVGTLAGGVAHEFNNLLTGIQGYAALGLREPDLSSDVRKFLQNIVELSDRAANVTRQLLAFARKPALRRQLTDMAELLTATAELVRHSMCIDVNVEMDESAQGCQPLLALIDANQVQQVLINLTLNARDALARPEPVLYRLQRLLALDAVAAFPDHVPPGDYVVLEVHDRGKGMTPEVLEHAFDPFFTTKDIGHGTGLGLPVAFGIVRGHLGYLTLDSRAGHGTTVRLYLPRLQEAPAAPPPPAAGADMSKETKTPGRTILLVDDEQAVLDVIRRYLEVAGHRVTCVTSGTEAQACLALGNISTW